MQQQGWGSTTLAASASSTWKGWPMCTSSCCTAGTWICSSRIDEIKREVDVALIRTELLVPNHVIFGFIERLTIYNLTAELLVIAYNAVMWLTPLLPRSRGWSSSLALLFCLQMRRTKLFHDICQCPMYRRHQTATHQLNESTNDATVTVWTCSLRQTKKNQRNCWKITL